MLARFKKIKWIKGSRDFVQGVKGGYRPRNAISGGNGSFVCETPAELILTVQTEDGREVSWNIISLVRAVNGWRRITQNRFDILEAKLKSVDKFILDNENRIVNLADYILV